jgi:hypothetical protein
MTVAALLGADDRAYDRIATLYPGGGQRPCDASHLDMRDEPDENRRKSHKAVDRCDKQRHLGHLDVLGHDTADGPPPAISASDSLQRPTCGARQVHAEDAVTDGPFGALLARATTQLEKNENRCNDIGSHGESVIPDAPLTTSRTWQTCANAEHRAIVDACAKGKISMAEALILQHVRGAHAALSKYLIRC